MPSARGHPVQHHRVGDVGLPCRRGALRRSAFASLADGKRVCTSHHLADVRSTGPTSSLAALLDPHYPDVDRHHRRGASSTSSGVARQRRAAGVCTARAGRTARRHRQQRSLAARPSVGYRNASLERVAAAADALACRAARLPVAALVTSRPSTGAPIFPVRAPFRSRECNGRSTLDEDGRLTHEEWLVSNAAKNPRRQLQSTRRPRPPLRDKRTRPSCPSVTSARLPRACGPTQMSCATPTSSIASVCSVRSLSVGSGSIATWTCSWRPTIRAG